MRITRLPPALQRAVARYVSAADAARLACVLAPDALERLFVVWWPSRAGGSEPDAVGCRALLRQTAAAALGQQPLQKGSGARWWTADRCVRRAIARTDLEALVQRASVARRGWSTSLYRRAHVTDVDADEQDTEWTAPPPRQWPRERSSVNVRIGADRTRGVPRLTLLLELRAAAVERCALFTALGVPDATVSVERIDDRLRLTFASFGAGVRLLTKLVMAWGDHVAVRADADPFDADPLDASLVVDANPLDASLVEWLVALRHVLGVHAHLTLSVPSVAVLSAGDVVALDASAVRWHSTP
jgi:hypothetical protein